MINVEVGDAWYSAFYEATSLQKRLGIARVVEDHPHVYPRTEWTMPAFAFEAKAGAYLPTRWDGRLSWLSYHNDE